MDVSTDGDTLYLYDDPVIRPDGTSAREAFLIPLAAVASWGELLGLSDEDALAAILAHQHPQPGSSPGDNGWTRLYETLVDEEETRMLVEQVQVRLAHHAPRREAEMEEGVPHAVTDAVERFGPRLVRDHVAAIKEDAQRAARSQMAVYAEYVPNRARSLVAERAAAISERRAEFRRQAAGLDLSPIGTEMR